MQHFVFFLVWSGGLVAWLDGRIVNFVDFGCDMEVCFCSIYGSIDD